ncbi:MAG: rod shape-determining protein [Clostridia bacterium]|nr:rod shape-determining protein [Clostridia bacterium]MBR2328064.1 rod shape-determining protein [Clostridia bacterium]
MFSNDIGVDLGTANTLIYKRGKGIIMREPSVISVNTETGKIVAVGNEAKKMLGRTPREIKSTRPLVDGVIADFDCAAKMLREFIKKTKSGGIFNKTRVVVCYPVGVSEVEKMAIEDAAGDTGAKKVYLIPEPFASAVGANLPVFDASGSMIVDIGGGTTEVAVLSLGGIVTSCSLRCAGDDMDKNIVNYVKKKYNLLIGERTAETVKLAIGSAFEGTEKAPSAEVRGRDLLNGLPSMIELSAEDVRDAIIPSVEKIAEAVHGTLEETPPELAGDIVENGIMLSGGGAMIAGIDKYLSKRLGVKVKIAADPLDCVAVGAGKMFDFLDTIDDITVG